MPYNFERYPSRILRALRLDAVPVQGITVSNEAMRVLDAVCETAGLHAAFIFGGYLRDKARSLLLDKPFTFNDIDIAGSVGVWGSKFERQSELCKAFNRLERSPHFPQTEILWEAPNSKIGIRTIFEGVSIDLSLLTGDTSPADYARFSDAPMNGIALNESGESFAHALFEGDLTNSFYRVQVAKPYEQSVAVARALNLKRRKDYGNLSIIHPDGYETDPDMPAKETAIRCYRAGKVSKQALKRQFA